MISRRWHLTWQIRVGAVNITRVNTKKYKEECNVYPKETTSLCTGNVRAV